MKISLLSGKDIPAAQDISILESLKKEGVYLSSSCGGKGICGKCKIIIKSGSADIRSKIKLTKEEIKKGYALACQSFPQGNILIEIPRESELTVDGKIATGKSKDLQGLLASAGAKIEPLTDRIVIDLPPPSLTDNISDLERLKRELSSSGLSCLRVPFRFLSSLASIVRKKNWEITLGIIRSEDCNEITGIFSGNKKTPRRHRRYPIRKKDFNIFNYELEKGSRQ